MAGQSSISARLLLSGVLSLAGAALAEDMPDSPDPQSLAELGPCPAGTTRRENSPEYTRCAWCEDAKKLGQGARLCWYPSGAVQSLEHSRNGSPDGWSFAWDESGKLRGASEHRKGRLVARRRMPSEPARASRPGDPVHPCPDGTVVAEGRSGGEQWCERQRSDGAYVRDGPWVTWSRDGNVRERGSYRDGVKNGEFSSFRPDGSPERFATYADDRGDTRASWYANGRKRVETETRPDGTTLTRRWSRDGTLRSEELSRGKEALRKTYYYENGKPKHEEHWSGGKRNGRDSEWWPSGALWKEGEQSDGHKVGTWSEWSPDGALMETEVYGAHGVVERKVERVWTDDPEGCALGRVEAPQRLQSVSSLRCPPAARPYEAQGLDHLVQGCAVGEGPIQFRADLLGALLSLGMEQRTLVYGGVPDGPIRVWHANGEPWFEGQFHQGKPHGRFTHWDEQGRINEARIEDGPDAETFTGWWRNGAVRVCHGKRDGKKHGVWVQCGETGLCGKREEYRNGLKHGLSVQVWEHGGKRSEIEYRNDEREGSFTTWSFEGTITSQGRFSAGKKTGYWVDQDDQGTCEGAWRDGNRQGPWTFSYPDGAVRARGRYDRDRRVGEWETFHPNGRSETRGAFVWCADPPRISVARFPDGGEVQDASLGGCKQGIWSYWTETGRLFGTLEHDETDPAKRPVVEPQSPARQIAQ